MEQLRRFLRRRFFNCTYLPGHVIDGRKMFERSEREKYEGIFRRVESVLERMKEETDGRYFCLEMSSRLREEIQAMERSIELLREAYREVEIRNEHPF